MQNPEPNENYASVEDSIRLLDIVAARYDLQIQQHTEELKRLRQRQLAKSGEGSAAAAPDFVIRKRRAA